MKKCADSKPFRLGGDAKAFYILAYENYFLKEKNEYRVEDNTLQP